MESVARNTTQTFDSGVKCTKTSLLGQFDKYDILSHTNL